MLVTRNSRDSSGHTYMVIDPDRYVVFGSHFSDMSYDRLTEEEKKTLSEFEDLRFTAKDAGVEYQFLAWHKKADLEKTELGKWGGFASERLKACWRHKKISEEWDRDPGSRPDSGDISTICRSERCR